MRIKCVDKYAFENYTLKCNINSQPINSVKSTQTKDISGKNIFCKRNIKIKAVFQYAKYSHSVKKRYFYFRICTLKSKVKQ